MTELAELVCRVLRDIGRDVELVMSGLPEPSTDVVNIVVAPHEFFHFAQIGGMPPDAFSRAVASSVCVTVEQMGTQWFDLEVELCEGSPLLLDINLTSVHALRECGFDVEHLQLGYHESIDHWHGDATAPRPIDLTFLGALTPRRERFLAGSAKLLWDRNCDLRLFTFDHPVTSTTPGFLLGEEKAGHLTRSKVLLNVHRDELGYFEWLRVIECVANGCLVVSEESLGYEPFVPFEHFIQAPLESLAEYAVTALIDEEWRSDIALAAYDHLRTTLDMVSIMRSMLPRIEEAAMSARPATEGRIIKVPFSTNGTSDPGMSTAPKYHPVMDVIVERQRTFRDTAKLLLNSQRSGIRQLERIKSALEHGTDSYVESVVSPSYESMSPDVSVVLTNYNYGHHITAAIDSVVASTGIVAELVIIDDHSADNSIEIIEAYLGERPWLPSKLIKNFTNRGLSEACNSGFRSARSDYVFVLDADNVVYPHGMNTLLRLLRTSPEDCAFAYGIVDCFADDEARNPVRLASCFPWDPYRLANANYIDAMALVRKSLWEEVGGYDWQIDERFAGLEDFDLWLRFASKGFHAAFAATPVASYRVHEASMINWVSHDAFDELRRRYPGLPWRPTAFVENPGRLANVAR